MKYSEVTEKYTKLIGKELEVTDIQSVYWMLEEKPTFLNESIRDKT